MASKKELIHAAELLRENCLSYLECDECPFFNPSNIGSIENSCCKLRRNYPDNWPELARQRWTLEDLGLAKALKNCGADRLIKSPHCVYVIFEDDNPGTKPWRLPPSMFAELKPGETITLDTIIEEADR